MADKEFYYEPDCGDDELPIVANNHVGEVESFTHNFDKMMLLVKQYTISTKSTCWPKKVSKICRRISHDGDS